ncbi:ABC transporter permease [Qipengyuania sediminis]|uniref:ABC transporter permease n=1 Tax=Qipengyuania sediminis TaxID=1532023 RepID=UPI00105968E7|nr:ABC transporter permease [Qipengyuania sediminis]
MTNPLPSARLSRFQAAGVIARRDFVAILFSRAFLFFLLGPLFPVAVGSLAGNIGGQVEAVARSNTVALAMTPADAARMAAAANAIGPRLAASIPALEPVAPGQPRAILAARGKAYAAVVSGTPAAPLLTGPQDQLDRLGGGIALIAASASGEARVAFAPLATEVVRETAAAARSDRIRTAQAGQLLLFLLTMLLAGMVLSNLVEEKANKIIEVLAAAIPMDAVFMGKLFAMLGVSFVGIAVWAGAAGAFLLASGGAAASLPAPALGWPLFLALGIAYFALAYLLLGALFLSIGALASTVREVQTLSMPVTMMQLMVFFLAAYALTVPGSWVELAAMVFPLSSPFAMLARAALSDSFWPHLVALAWQGLWVLLVVRGGAALFRRRVMKSGRPDARRSRKGFGSLRTVDSPAR